MMQKRASAGIVALALIAAPATAADWAQQGTGQSGDRIFVDNDSMQFGGGNVVLWTKLDYASPDAAGIAETKALYDFDCKAKSYKVRATNSTDTNGRFVSGFTYDPPAQHSEPIVPDTLLESVFKGTCGDPFLMALGDASEKRARVGRKH
jgi:hypothetical protein